MDYIDYSDKTYGTRYFPTPAGASTSNPSTLHNVHNDLIYVNTGSGWQPMLHLTSGSVYSAYTTASPTTQAAIIASVTKTSSAPSTAHTTTATVAATVAIRGR
jgi:hypothetical protein